MKTMKKACVLGLLALLIMIMMGAGETPTLARSGVPPTLTNNLAAPSSNHLNQSLVYVYQDATNIWHLSRYNIKTGQKSDIVTTAEGRIADAQVSADGKQVLFLTELYPAMQTTVSAKIQVVNLNGQGLQTLYSVAPGSYVSGLEWSPDQRFLAFQEHLNVYLLHVASRTTRLVIPASGYQGFLPRTWLDNTHLYLTPYAPSQTPPLQLSLLDIRTNQIEQVLHLPTLGGDFARSIDGKTLFTSQYVFAMPAAEGPSSIEAQPATGGQATAIYQTSDYAITNVRVASCTSLLFLIHNTGVGNVDISHNGLWKIALDGTRLTRLTSESSEEHTMFSAFTRYVRSIISRDGSLYAVKVIQTTVANGPSSILVGSMKGGKPMPIASTDNATALEIVGWI